MASVKKVVFPVAGLGTRFRPVTSVVPKEMLPVVDKPLIDYAIEEAVNAGITDLIFVVSKDKEIIVKYLSDKDNIDGILKKRSQSECFTIGDGADPSQLNIEFVVQDQALGLGHAILCAQKAVGDDPFAVLLPDDLIVSEVPCLAQMVDKHQEVGGNVLAVVEVEPQKSHMYGILKVAELTDDLLKVTGMCEKPSPEKAPSNFAIVGRYILDTEIFKTLSQQPAGMGGEIQLTEAMNTLLMRQDFYGLRFSGIRYDCGDKVGLLEANIACFLRRTDLSIQAQKVVERFVLSSPRNEEDK
ncbi:MAG: UTP--glucose-1-phosphate uridylyltransferase [Pseudomonadota bacterium]|nr:UTP--glucose-1-phosphate uridylyltransferase [Pseudomonadota bacterium]